VGARSVDARPPSPRPRYHPQQVDYLSLIKLLLDHGAIQMPNHTRRYGRPSAHNDSWAKAAGATPFWACRAGQGYGRHKCLWLVGRTPKFLRLRTTPRLPVAAGVGWNGNFPPMLPIDFLRQ